MDYRIVLIIEAQQLSIVPIIKDFPFVFSFFTILPSSIHHSYTHKSWKIHSHSYKQISHCLRPIGCLWISHFSIFSLLSFFSIIHRLFSIKICGFQYFLQRKTHSLHIHATQCLSCQTLSSKQESESFYHFLDQN